MRLSHSICPCEDQRRQVREQGTEEDVEREMGGTVHNPLTSSHMHTHTHIYYIMLDDSDQKHLAEYSHRQQDLQLQSSPVTKLLSN